MSIESSESAPRVTAELVKPSAETWASIKDDVLRIEQECFGEASFTEEDFQDIIDSPRAIIAVLRSGRQIIGFSVGGPDEDSPGAVTIYATDITPVEQGKGHVGPLMRVFEEEARKQGYAFLTRHAAIANGYADKIQKHYADRIVESSERDSQWGPQRYFKIAL